MKKLTVLYDSDCGFCVKCRWWMAKQAKFVAMEFLPAHSPEVRRRFPALAAERGEELIVIDDDAAVYRGSDAFLMCLWALEEYREWSLRLAAPLLRPFARAALELVSTSRRAISKLFGLEGEALAAELRRSSPPTCVSG